MLETAFSGLRRYPLCGHKAVAFAASVAATAAAHLLAFKTLLVCFPLRFCFFFRSSTFLFQINWVVREAICAGSSRLEVPASSRLLLPFFFLHIFFAVPACAFTASSSPSCSLLCPLLNCLPTFVFVECIQIERIADICRAVASTLKSVPPPTL